MRRTASEGTERRAIAAIRSVLPPAVGVTPAPPIGGQSDLVIAGTPVAIKWLTDGSLGSVRRLVAHSQPDIVVSSSLSPGARQLLSESEIGWVDESGAAEILLSTLVVSRAGSQPHERPDNKRWTPAVLSVTEALLCGTRATVSETAAATGLSSGSCTRALRILTDAGLLEASSARGRSSARQVTDFEQLFAAYRAKSLNLAVGPRLEIGVLWRDVLDGLEEIGRSWNQQGVAWATTGFAAAALMAPLMSNVSSADVYVAATTLPELRNIATAVGLAPIEGGRLVISPFPTSASRTLATSSENIMVAPWPRVYVDLTARGVRGEESAEHLREVLNV